MLQMHTGHVPEYCSTGTEGTSKNYLVCCKYLLHDKVDSDRGRSAVTKATACLYPDGKIDLHRFIRKSITVVLALLYAMILGHVMNGVQPAGPFVIKSFFFLQRQS